MKIKYLLYNYPRNLIAIIILVRNWYAPLLYKTHLCNNIKIYFRDGDVVDTQIPFHINWDALLRIILLKYYLDSFSVHKDKDEILFIINNDIKLSVDKYHIQDSLVLIAEQFKDDYYRVQNRTLENKTIIDIGANIGDAAILFAKKGAIVYSFEPIKAAFNQMGKNILLNNIQDRIRIYNVALSDHDEEREIEYDIYGIGGFSLSNLGSDKHLIKERIIIVETLRYFSEKEILSCDIIKMDCEGSEAVLLKDSRLIDFLKPHEVMVEYHKYNDGQILKTLRKKYAKIEIVPFKDNPGFGMIYAENLITS
jgi:FkbM family methyltransferase